MIEFNPPQDLIESFNINEQLPQGKAPEVNFHFVRHAQATHNLRSLTHNEALNIHNPPLTELGIAQATHLPQTFAPISRLTHALVSPSQRTLQTLLLGFRPTLLANKITAIAYPSIRELTPALCNLGGDVSELKLSMLGEPVDMRLVKEGWGYDGNEGEENYDSNKRVEDVKWDLLVLKKVLIQGGHWKGIQFPKWEKDQDIEILVVSHGAFLKKLLRRGSAADMKQEEFDLTFFNCQYRTFSFPSTSAIDAGAPPLELIQDLITVGRGIGLSWSRMGFGIEKDVEEWLANFPQFPVIYDNGEIYVGGLCPSDPTAVFHLKHLM